MALTERQVAEALAKSQHERPEWFSKAQIKAERRQAYQDADEETKKKLRGNMTLVTASDLEEMHADIKQKAAEVRTMYDNGIQKLGVNFGKLIDKHLEIAFGDDKEAIQERRFLIKLFADLRPDMAVQTSANELMMAAGRKAMNAAKVSLVRESVEFSDASPPSKPDGAA